MQRTQIKDSNKKEITDKGSKKEMKEITQEKEI